MGGGTTSSTKATVPKELSGLYSSTGRTVQNLQNQAPVSNFTGAYTPSGYTRMPNGMLQPIGGGQEQSLRDVLRPQGKDILNSPSVKAAQTSFREGAIPNIVQEQTLSGLGRSPDRFHLSRQPIR